jgi:hypothetical protein
MNRLQTSLELFYFRLIVIGGLILYFTLFGES